MAYLKNDYKIMYENRTITSGVLDGHLKATKSLPDCLADPNLTYRKYEDSSVIDPKNFKFITEKDHLLFGSYSGKSSEATVEFSIYSGYELVFGRETIIPKVKVTTGTTLANTTSIIKDTNLQEVEIIKGTACSAIVYPSSGYHWKTVPTTCLINGAQTTIAGEGVGNVIAMDLSAVNEDTVISFNSGEAEINSNEVTITANKSSLTNVQWGFYGEEPQEVEISKKVEKGNITRVYIQPKSGYVWNVAPTTCKVDGTDVAVIHYGETDYYYVNVNETVQDPNSIAVVFDTGTTKVKTYTVTVSEFSVFNYLYSKDNGNTWDRIMKTGSLGSDFTQIKFRCLGADTDKHAKIVSDTLKVSLESDETGVEVESQNYVLTSDVTDLRCTTGRHM